jgi:[ribosomal protein S5]-alanine N-acetyltransferase
MLLENALELERVVLASLTPIAAEGRYLDWVQNPMVNRYLELRHSPPDKVGIQRFIEEMNASDDCLFLGIFTKDKMHIGNVKLGPIDWVNCHAVIGLMVGEVDLWGKGFGTEVISGITHYSIEQLELHHLSASCYASNLGSLMAFARAGFDEVG